MENIFPISSSGISFDISDLDIGLTTPPRQRTLPAKNISQNYTLIPITICLINSDTYYDFVICHITNLPVIGNKNIFPLPFRLFQLEIKK